MAKTASTKRRAAGGRLAKSKPQAKAAARASSMAKATAKANAQARATRGAKPEKLGGSFRRLGRACKTLVRQWKIILGILLIYGVINILLVRGVGNTDLMNVKNTLIYTFKGTGSGVSNSLTLYGSLLTTGGGTSSSTSGVYETFLLVVTSLALIWALRNSQAQEEYQAAAVEAAKKEAVAQKGKKSRTKAEATNAAPVAVKLPNLRIRDAYYKGSSQIIPFLLVLIVIGIQFIPLLIGGSLYGAVISNGIARNLFEKFIWLGLFLLLASITIYFLSSSIFALYIVTVPDMTPFRALKAARKLVRKRRLSIIRKLLFLALVIFVAATIIVLPMILVLTTVATWIYFILTWLALALFHAYMYSLYREML